MRWWELTRLALGGIRRTPLRVTLTALGVAIATGALVSMVAYAVGIQEQIEEPFHRLDLLSRLDVTVKDDGTSSDGPPPPPLDDEAVARIRALPGVTVAYPEFHLGRVDVLGGPKPIRTSALGLPYESGRLGYARAAVVAGRFFEPANRNEVLVGAVLADRIIKELGLASRQELLGRSLTLRIVWYPSGEERPGEGGERKIDVTVVGLWQPVSNPLVATPNFLLLPLDLVREMPGSFHDATRRDRPGDRPEYRKVVVRVAQPGDVFLVEEKIKQMGYHTGNFLTQLKELRTFFLIMKFTLAAVAMVALTVAGLGIINTMLMAVLERYREIGTYKALGASNGDIRVLFLAEAALVGLLGGLGGLLLGWVVSLAIGYAVHVFARRMDIREQVVSFAFPLWLLAGAVLFAVVISLIGGVYPASRAARVDPIRALRSE